jgi:Mce-associated membrane protein
MSTNPDHDTLPDDPSAAQAPDEVPAKSVESNAAKHDSALKQDDADQDAAGTDVSAGNDAAVSSGRWRPRWAQLLTWGLLPLLCLLLTAAAGYLKWQDYTARGAQVAGVDALKAATDGTVAMLSYRPDTVQQQLDATRDKLTGKFLDSYTSLIHDVVIPAAQQKKISVQATVPAAAAVSSSADHAVVLLFINQAAVVGNEPPSKTVSNVRVTLERIGGRWLISAFEPL